MADTTDTANVIIRPSVAWAVAVLAGLALNWLMPLPFLPAASPALSASPPRRLSMALLTRAISASEVCGVGTCAGGTAGG
jgi:hypothetical protein